MAQGDTKAPPSQCRRRSPGGVQGNLPDLIAETRDGDPRRLRLQFFDEARFGRITRPVRSWAPEGMRPIVTCQTVREYLYLYGGACPHDGSFDAMIMPSMHVECFELYCAEVSRRYPDELVVIVCDGAGSHCATDLSLPENVRTITLPPYSPELNPAEQVWDLIRETDFANRTHDDLDQVERQLTNRVLALEDDPATVKSLTQRGWITSISLTRN